MFGNYKGYILQRCFKCFCKVNAIWLDSLCIDLLLGLLYYWDQYVSEMRCARSALKYLKTILYLKGLF